MKKTMLLLGNTLKRSRFFLLGALLGGVILCLIYNGMAGLYEKTGEGIPVGYYPHEDGFITDDLRAYLGDELGMVLTESTDMEYLNTEMVERNVAAVIEVPAGFEAAILGGEALPLEVSFLDDYANSAFIMSYLENYTAGLGALAAGAGGDAGTLATMLGEMQSAMVPVTVTQSDGEAFKVETQKNAFRQVAGFYLMFCFMLAFGLSTQLLDDRRLGMYLRMKASNLRTVQYLVGTCAPSMLCSVCLIAPFFVYIAAGGQAIGMHLGQAVVLCLLYALFVVAVAVVTAMYASSRNAVSAILIGTATITCMLGGAYFPTETSPEFLQRLARATPQFWFMSAVDILQKDPDGSWLLNAAVITLFALLFFILAGIKFVKGGKARPKAAA